MFLFGMYRFAMLWLLWKCVVVSDMLVGEKEACFTLFFCL